MTKQFLDLYELADFDCNKISETAHFDVQQSNAVHLFISGLSGAHATHVIQAFGAGVDSEGNPTDFFPITGATVLGLGDINVNGCTYSFMKFKVTTIEPIASNVKLVANIFYTPTPPN